MGTAGVGGIETKDAGDFALAVTFFCSSLFSDSKGPVGDPAAARFLLKTNAETLSAPVATRHYNDDIGEFTQGVSPQPLHLSTCRHPGQMTTLSNHEVPQPRYSCYPDRIPPAHGRQATSGPPSGK